MLTRALKMAFWVTFDHVGKLILANIIWFLAVAVPGFFAVAAFFSGDPGVMLFIGVPAGILCLGIALPIATAGLAQMVKELIDRRDGSVGDMLGGMRLYWKRAAGLGMVYLLATSCFASSTWFYTSKLKESAPWLGYALSGLALWCLAFALVMLLLVMPALVQKRRGVRETLKLTALLVLDNPLFTLGLMVQVVAVIAISVIFTPLMFFLCGSVVVVMVSSAYEMLARKYADITNEEGKTAQQARKARLEEEDRSDDYLNRGFRDLLFPWKG